MKYVHLFLAILYLSFAIVQWNDPDGLIWIIVYLMISVIAFLAFRGSYHFWFCLVLTITLLVSASFYIPELLDWINDGMPDIADSMKASSPYIELVREFFGLMTALITMTFYLVISKKKKL
ncbi:MAG: hypothetical protein HKN09_11920 [Saprospiraceae bacterium]|nr:hypothetical protein [Saprospiraceae bacterium]